MKKHGKDSRKAPNCRYDRKVFAPYSTNILVVNTHTQRYISSQKWQNPNTTLQNLQTLPKNQEHHQQTVKQKYIRFSPSWVLNSFNEHTPQNRACSIARISAGRKMTAIPLARNALAGLSVASSNTLTSSSSSNFPFNPRVNLSQAIWDHTSPRWFCDKPGERPFSGVRVQVRLIPPLYSFQIIRWDSLW